MEKMKFVHRVSKGTRFNQIYIPNEMKSYFQSGDLVEVILLERKNSLYYSSTLTPLSEFKENLIKNIFLELKEHKEISQIFVIGSFLTQKQDFNDIDIILISDNKEGSLNKNIEKEVYDLLTNKFELKFHIISIPKDKFENLQRYCPITRSMLYYFVSNKEFKISKQKEINLDHLRFLLMMPEDILKININSRIYYDSIRRLITVERFLDNQSLNPLEINKEIRNITSEDIISSIKQNETISQGAINNLRKIIKSKLKIINTKLKNKGKDKNE